jgi:hypothetical protein
MIDHLNFKVDGRFVNHIFSKYFYIKKDIYNKKGKLKFYDPEENMEYFNRLFNVLGILDLYSESLDYYVSKKFVNDNAKYVELLRIMYSYEYRR